MRKKIRFTVYGVPRPKSRPRMFRKNGKQVVYNPSLKDEQNFLLQSLAFRPEKPLNKPLCLKIEAYFPLTKGMTKGLKEKALKLKAFPAKKPDIDNLLKLVCDSLQEKFFTNDNLFVDVHIQKFYSDTPRTEVEIWEK